MKEELIFEKSVSGRRGYTLPPLDVPEASTQELIPKRYLRKREHQFPEMSEAEVVRHYTRLSTQNFGVDLGFYPLGSCTMKYNPKINEDLANLPGFLHLHPLQPESLSQGGLRLMYELAEMLGEIAGMARVTLQPAAGAHGELAGLLMMRAYHEKQGNPRKHVLIPDSAHGTNPASAVIAGYSVQTIRSNKSGLVDLDDLKRHADEDCAGFMLTNPNTLGLFERDILQIQKILHEVGGLLYLDGANLNAFLDLCRPGDMGFDVVHFNLHKTFTVPHGGGGPGAGALGVGERLVPFLPVPIVERDGERFYFDYDNPDSIGRLHGFYGNFGNMVRAYTYVRRMGAPGLEEVSRNAILNANYVRKRLEGHYPIPYNRACMHEVVLSAKRFRAKGVHAWDIAKRLIDFGIHPPTVNFPLVVDEAIMIEPTETESKETLDQFCDAMIAIAQEIEDHPDRVTNAPLTTSTSRLDEKKAVKDLNVRWSPQH